MSRNESRGLVAFLLLVAICVFWEACRDVRTASSIDLRQLAWIAATEPVDVVQDGDHWIAGASAECVVNPAIAGDPITALLAYRDSLAAYAKRRPTE